MAVEKTMTPMQTFKESAEPEISIEVENLIQYLLKQKMVDDH